MLFLLMYNAHSVFDMRKISQCILKAENPGILEKDSPPSPEIKQLYLFMYVSSLCKSLISMEP